MDVERLLDVAVLIPAHNEAEAIAETVRAARAISGVTRVVVVDDGSTDGTDRLAEDAGAKVVRLSGNAGKGAALEAGAMRVENADIILLLDGDLGSTASQGALLLEPVLSGKADMTIARFPRPAGKAGFGLVKGLARSGIRLLGGPGFSPMAPLSGQRAVTSQCFAIIRPFSAGYGVEVGATIRALRAGLRIEEVETTMTHAATGRDVRGFVHRGRQFAHVLIALVRLAFEPKRRA
ncbi:MAG: glycosyltransferase family 2 protein [Coriobacteriia bacterium]